MTVYCISDRYTSTRDCFDSVDAFLVMSRACFGEAPELRESSPGEWTDVATGERVLEGPSRADFVALFDSVAKAEGFESWVLSAGSEFLSDEEIAVLNGEVDEPSSAYWAGMIAAVQSVDDLDSCAGAA